MKFNFKVDEGCYVERNLKRKDSRVEDVKRKTYNVQLSIFP